MADELIDPLGHQAGGCFEFIGWLSHSTEQDNSVDDRDKTHNQKNPRYDLVPGERVGIPESHVEYEHTENNFPGKEAVKTVRTWLAQGWDGDPDNANGPDDEDDCLNHSTSLLHAGENMSQGFLGLRGSDCQDG